jgi:outer membrane protein insertion porin family
MKEGRVRIVIREGPHVRVNHIRYAGNDTLTDDELGKQIDSKAYMWIFAAGELNEQTVKNDVVRLIQYYRDQGFLDVSEKTLSYQLEFSPDQTNVTIVFLIHEGARYKVGSVKFEGNTEAEFPTKDLRGLMLLQPDQFFTADNQKHDIKAITDQVYGARGYVNTKVDIIPRFADQPGVVNLIVRIVEAEQIFVGRIRIVGNDVTHDNVILREVVMQPTDPYNVLDAEESRRRLINTRLFGDKVEIAPAPTGPGNQRDVIVTVEESRTTSFMIGAGISSDAGLLGNITIENRNFDLFGWPKEFTQMFSNQAFKGAGQTLRVVAEPGTGMNRFQIQFFEPYLMDQDLSLGSNLYYFEAPRYGLDDSSDISYRESHVGYIMSLGQRFRKNWSLEEAVRIEDVDISSVNSESAPEVKKDAGQHVLIGGKFTLARDTTDSRFAPSSGDRFYVSAEPVGGTDDFVKLIGGYTAYQTLRTDVYDRKTILSERVTTGYIPGSAPIFERFYAGGIDTMRGFAYRSVSPHDGPLDDPVGGNFEFLASSEYIFPLIAKSQGVFFLDTGTVEKTPGFSAYRASVGFEVRIPIDFFGSVPLTLGVGVPVVQQSGDKSQIFHFMFGASF